MGEGGKQEERQKGGRNRHLTMTNWKKRTSKKVTRNIEKLNEKRPKRQEKKRLRVYIERRVEKRRS